MRAVCESEPDAVMQDMAKFYVTDGDQRWDVMTLARLVFSPYPSSLLDAKCFKLPVGVLVFDPHMHKTKLASSSVTLSLP